ncbi:MAG: peptidylprolyl isomerase [Pirellulales bacterium]
MHVRFCLALLVVSFVATYAVSAEPPKAPPAKPQAPAPEFDKLATQFKASLTQLRELQAKFRIAKPEEQAALEKQYDQIVGKVKTMLPAMKTAAEKAYRAAPNKNEEVAAFLFDMVIEALQGGNFKESGRLAKLLIDNKHPQAKDLLAIAGMAAFNDGDLAAADKYFKTVQADDPTNEAAKKYLDEIKFRAADAKANDRPRVLLKTAKGDILIELFENEAPNTVANFISLVEKKFYDGLTFHRVLDGFMAQGGDPTGTGAGGPGYYIPCECYAKNHRNHFRGSLSMAHAGKDTGGSQFFLTFGPTDHLDGKHTVFGRVIQGDAVLDKLQRRDPDDPNAPKPDKILEAKVIRKRAHKYEPTKLPETKPGR